ncbi:MAG: hypothetical protein COU25_03680 [Candidatus Levybacteria bacterium CG10_big_fil_rev_8_21_14_0_10_35_13]|nr:MAG: hypothetical protein COU25_03680 [Candidatus Levybacteria bacterium CG10_big_fil_rev_8_21_14_0_10_35_13]
MKQKNNKTNKNNSDKTNWKKYLLLGGIAGLIGVQSFHNKIFSGPDSRLRKALFYASLASLVLYSRCGDTIDQFVDKDVKKLKQYELKTDSLNNVVSEQYKTINSLDSLNSYLKLKNKILNELKYEGEN